MILRDDLVALDLPDQRTDRDARTRCRSSLTVYMVALPLPLFALAWLTAPVTAVNEFTV